MVAPRPEAAARHQAHQSLLSGSGAALITGKKPPLTLFPKHPAWPVPQKTLWSSRTREASGLLCRLLIVSEGGSRALGRQHRAGKERKHASPEEGCSLGRKSQGIRLRASKGYVFSKGWRDPESSLWPSSLRLDTGGLIPGWGQEPGSLRCGHRPGSSRSPEHEPRKLVQADLPEPGAQAAACPSSSVQSLCQDESFLQSPESTSFRAKAVARDADSQASPAPRAANSRAAHCCSSGDGA